MAVALLAIPASMTAEQYDRVVQRLEASGAGAPPGRRIHACFGSDHHLMVFDVWDSVEELQEFRATLIPILATEEIEVAPGEPVEIHRLSASGALGKTIEAGRHRSQPANDPQLYG